MARCVFISASEQGAALNPDGFLRVQPWGHTSVGEEVTLFTLSSRRGLVVRVMNYGGVIVGVEMAGRTGERADVTLGHAQLAPYLDRGTSPYFGALVGRVANRVRAGRFMLGGAEYQLPVNDGRNHLHGGPGGFDQRLWQASSGVSEEGPFVRLSRISPDGEEGYPGTLTAEVTYLLRHDDTLTISARVTTTRPTHVNLTNHTYWNLNGGRRDVLDHLLWVDADRYVPVDAEGLPLGGTADVTDTPLDFRSPRRLGERRLKEQLSETDVQPDARSTDARSPDIQARQPGGYDHTLVLNGSGLRHVATLSDPSSGRRLEVSTTEPGVQVYSGNFLDGSIVGRDAQRYGQHWGLCLETQHFPDSPNQPAFPSTRLDPGGVYTSVTRFAFSVSEAGDPGDQAREGFQKTDRLGVV